MYFKKKEKGWSGVVGQAVVKKTGVFRETGSGHKKKKKNPVSNGTYNTHKKKRAKGDNAKRQKVNSGMGVTTGHGKETKGKPG